MDIRIAIFEDNVLVREALSAILNEQTGFVCSGVFENGNRWKQDIEFSRPDVVLMDIEMPGLNGIELTQAITTHFMNIKVLIQTVFGDSEKIFRALCAGASGYMLKNDPPTKYIEAINEIAGGGAFMNPSIARKVLSFFGNKHVMPFSPVLTEDELLSEREQQILQLMTEGFDYRTISEKVFISYETVRTHVKHIYRKLHVNCRTEAVIKAEQRKIFSNRV